MIRMNLGMNSYNIEIERGGISKAKEYFNLNRNVMIITDEGVPVVYAEKIAEQCRKAYIKVVPQGEESKSFQRVEEILKDMLELQFSRKDCVIAVGGGVIGDLAGFVASLYMRGIDFYNVPTTVLSQVDSSIGGKTAVNLTAGKNLIGAFYQPKAVLIDPETLKTLSERHFSNGLAEAVKMALTFDPELFRLFEEKDAHEHIEEIIMRSVKIKAYVIEQDEKEKNLRKILNFGHTIGHAIESAEELGGLYHGECVALGMIYMSSDEVKVRLIPVLKKLNLPKEYQGDAEKLMAIASHDKKFSGENITVVILPEIGRLETEEWTKQELFDRIKEALA